MSLDTGNATKWATDSANNLTWNATAMEEEENWAKLLDQASVIIMTVNLVILMFGMGAATHIWEIWENIKRPWACLIGMAFQFFALPAFGYGLCWALSLTNYESLGVLFLTCSPGGALSILFTYCVDGDLALSILMTTASCLLAFGAMPLNLWAYSRFWTDEELKIPYVNVLISMAFVTGPTIVGMVFRHFSRIWADRISKICSILGWAGAFACGAFIVLIYWETIAETTWNLLVAAALVPVFGFLASYILLKIFCFRNDVSRTVGLETGCQNIVVATNVALMTFTEKEIRGQMIVFPAVYGIMQLGEVFVFILLYQIHKFIHRDDVTEEEVGSAVDTKILTRVPLPVLPSSIFSDQERKPPTAPDVVYSKISEPHDAIEQRALTPNGQQYMNEYSHPNDRTAERTIRTNGSLSARSDETRQRRSPDRRRLSRMTVSSHTVSDNSSDGDDEPWYQYQGPEYQYANPDHDPIGGVSQPAETASRHWDPMSHLIDQRNQPRSMVRIVDDAVAYNNYAWGDAPPEQPSPFYNYEGVPVDTPRSPSLSTGYSFSTFRK